MNDTHNIHIEKILHLGQQKENIVFRANRVSHRSHILDTPKYFDFLKIERALTNTTKPFVGLYFYVAFLHTDVICDVHDLDQFVPVHQYSQIRLLPLSNQEIGFIGKYWPYPIRFIVSPNYPVFLESGGFTTLCLSNSRIPDRSSRCDVYPIIITGKELDASKIIRYEVATRAF